MAILENNELVGHFISSQQSASPLSTPSNKLSPVWESGKNRVY
jgi:hypothetical protein